MLFITILSGPPGCGKTWTMLNEMVGTPGRYVLAMTRVGLLKERPASLSLQAPSSPQRLEPIVSPEFQDHIDPRPVEGVLRDAPATNGFGP